MYQNRTFSCNTKIPRSVKSFIFHIKVHQTLSCLRLNRICKSQLSLVVFSRESPGGTTSALCPQRCACVSSPGVSLGNTTIKRVRHIEVFWQNQRAQFPPSLYCQIERKPLSPAEMTYRCSRVVDQETVELEILDLVCKVTALHLPCMVS